MSFFGGTSYKRIIVFLAVLSFCLWQNGASAQRVLQCTPGAATVRNNLQVGIPTDLGNLWVTGNAGIGTPSNPAVRLDVNGNIQGGGFIGTTLGSAATPIFRFAGNPDSGLFSPTANELGLSADGVERIRISALGNVGIGVPNPVTKLDVAGDVRWSGTLQGGTVPWARLNNFPTACPGGQYVTGVGGTLTCAAEADTLNSITTRGNTTANSITVAGITITGGAPGLGKVLTSDATGAASWQAAAGGLPAATTAGQTLRADGTNWVANSLLFNNGTNIGIGTTAPGARFDIQNPSGTALTIVARVLNLNNVANNNGVLINIARTAPNTDAYALNVQTGGTSRLYVRSNGNVGIGTTSPQNLLHVNGVIRATDIVASSGRSLTQTNYINSDNTGNLVWTNDVATRSDTSATGGWVWTPFTFFTLPNPIIALRLRGSSDNGGVCWIYVSGAPGLFSANITRAGYTPSYDLSSMPAGGSYSGSATGAMLTTTFVFSDLASGPHHNQNGAVVTNNWGYVKPAGLSMIPAGRSIALLGGRWNGGGAGSVNCSLDVAYATQVLP